MPKNIIINNKVLDRYQTKAVLCKKRAYLVVAGAGSGKTLTIVAKVDYLIKHNVKQNKILCISFTNETVNSLTNKLKENNLNVDVKTFHRLSLDLIGRKYGIISSNLLEYITDEFFESLIYNDNTYKLLKFVNNIDYLKKIIISFINQMKALNYNEIFILSLLRNKLIDSDDKIILIFILKIYVIYQEELTSVNKIDFNDMINLAIIKIDKLDYFKYSHIIIDEYQDTSESKYQLIKKLYEKFNIYLMAVGDDYQSIYSFTGCNLNLFIKFKKCFKKSKVIKIKRTYRNPYVLVEISRRFIIKNKNQINKRLISEKCILNSINIVYIKDEIDAFKYITKDLDNIMVLARNNRDLDNIKSIDHEKNIKLLTVHASKGLEEDYVIVLNVVDDTLGFPNKIKDNKVLSYISNYNHLEEERRLFYVALTRTKIKTFLFTIKGKESIFIKELLSDFKRRIKIIDLDQK